MEILINGKTKEQVFTELAAPISQDKLKLRDYDGRYYLPIDAALDILNEVVGPDHYSDEYVTQLVQAKDTCAFTAVCTLKIFDDSGNVAIVKSMAGGSTIAFPYDKESRTRLTECNSIPNDATAACQDAFKKVLTKRFGIGKTSLDFANAGSGYDVTLTKAFKEYNGNYFGECTLDGKTVNLAIFKSDVAKFDIEQIKSLQSKSLVDVRGKLGKDKKGNDQIIVKAISIKETPVATSTPTNSKPIERVNLSIIAPAISLTSGNGYKIAVIDADGVGSDLIVTADKVEQLLQIGVWPHIIKGESININVNAQKYVSSKGCQFVFVDMAA